MKNISLNDSPQDFNAKLKENILFLKYKSKNLCKFYQKNHSYFAILNS